MAHRSNRQRIPHIEISIPPGVTVQGPSNQDVVQRPGSWEWTPLETPAMDLSLPATQPRRPIEIAEISQEQTLPYHVPGQQDPQPQDASVDTGDAALQPILGQAAQALQELPVEQGGTGGCP